ncbi:hypothetical protein COOONC_16831 [Cooperia oncophora]
MLLLFLIGCVAATVNPEPAPVQGSNAYPYAYAVDFSGPASNFSCLKSSNYRTVFVRATNTSINRRNFSAGLGVEAYMTPQIRSSKNASMQFDEILNGLNAAGINLKKLWIQVTAPANWDPYPQKNVYFLNQIVMAAQVFSFFTALSSLSFIIGIELHSAFTPTFTTGPGLHTMRGGVTSQLWYWNVRGEGPQGETGANFYDFRPFGSWFRPTVKQFAQAENVCGMTVNR